jgi:4-hydroxy-tetrahydrodipicolinate synthase
MIRLARANQFDEARKIHYRLLPIIKSIFMDGNPGGIKYLLSRMGICENYFRLPVHPVNQATMTAIDDAFAKW